MHNNLLKFCKPKKTEIKEDVYSSVIMVEISDHESFLQMHVNNLFSDIHLLADGRAGLVLPFPEPNYILDLAHEIIKICHVEPTLLELEGPMIVVGDLHGHLLDLYRIFQFFGMPPATNYLFIGDIVDRGEFSIETLCLIYVLKILYPKNVFIIRGNHEFRNTSINGGLLIESEKTYPHTEVFEALVNSFRYIPLAAKIGNKILCVHGGLSPSFTSLEQLAAVQRPVDTYDDSILCGLLWSDPSEKTQTFMPSPRGTGFLFGNKAISAFLKNNQLDMIIRGHECVKNGFLSRFDGKVMTVFSASNYCGVTNNKGAVAMIDENNNCSGRSFFPFPYLKRNTTMQQPTNFNNQSLRKTLHVSYQQSQAPITQKLNAATMTVSPNRLQFQLPGKVSMLDFSSNQKISKIIRKYHSQSIANPQSTVSSVLPAIVTPD